MTLLDPLTEQGPRAPSLDRRELLGWSASCAAHLVFCQTFARAARATGPAKLVDEQPWGRLEQIGDRAWAVVSTPLLARDFTTICNGGIIAGEDRVLVVESFGSPAGSRWVAEHASKLTGRRPTDVVITHFHGDHANGIEGFATGDEDPALWLTPKTHELIREADREREIKDQDTRLRMLEGRKTIGQEAIAIDLGGRLVELHPRRGHTPSDVTIEISEPAISFCGDLVWNGFFPNYRDTLPSEFADSLRALRRDASTVYVSGHGPVADLATVDLLIDVVDHIGEAAQHAHTEGIDVATAAAAYTLPEPAASWHLFSPSYFEVAFKAWYRELG